MQMLVSVVQIVAALYTLYSTEGEQIARWGYAAYGLSVLPYALMSVTNILSASIVGEYMSGHVLRTLVLREAERREVWVAAMKEAEGRLEKALALATQQVDLSSRLDSRIAMLKDEIAMKREMLSTSV